jgi:glycosyltransferase involved in cell wall biosynthesis
VTRPVRLTIVLTHPIQYYAPWFRYVTANAPEIDLTVVHATEPTPEQQGVGFGRAFAWDIPLTEGYRNITARPADPDDRVDSGTFTGVNVPEISRVIAETAPDVVMITGWYSLTLVRALFACRRLGVPVLYRGDSHLRSGAGGWKRPLRALKTRVLLRQFSAFLSPGVRVNEYLRWYGIAERRIFQVPHAVDNQMFAAAVAPYRQPDVRAEARRRCGIDPEAFVVLFVGKLVASKRPLDLVRAVGRLAPGATLLVVGSGPLETAVREEAARLNVSIAMVGFKNQSELGEPYGIADCLTLPSVAETWGLVVNEALATGLPCVVSDAVGCARDLISDGDTGYVYPLDDIGALATALTQVRHRKAAGYDWRPACRARIASYSFATMTRGLVRAVRSLLPSSQEPEPDRRHAGCRIIACCGQMVTPGGLERMTFEVLRAVKEQGAESHVIVNDWENFRITPFAEENGATWSTAPYRYELTRRDLTPWVVARMALEITAVSANLLRQSWRIRPTHILLPDFVTALRNGPALLWLRLCGVRVIIRVGNAPAPGAFYAMIWSRLVDRLVDRFVANSSYTSDQLAAAGIRVEKIETITNVVPHRPASCGERCRIAGRVIFVGQIIPDKGLHLLLEAIAIVRRRGLAATLDVVGEMDGWEAPSYNGYRAAVRARAARSDLAGATNFLGYREDVLDLMARATVHCCPSLPEQREAFGVVVLEAKSSSTPSIVTPSGNLPALVRHGIDGWICPSADAESIAEAIAFFLTSTPAAQACARRAALESVTRYPRDRFDAAWGHVFSTAGGPHADQ